MVGRQLKKILCLSHVPWESTYGAGTSLRMHWKSLEPEMKSGSISVTLIYRIGFHELFRRSSKVSQENVFFERIGKLVLSPDRNCENSKHVSLFLMARMFVSRIINKIIEIISVLYLARLCEKKQFEIIHFNSLVLVTIANNLRKITPLKKSKFILHVREFLLPGLSVRQKSKFNAIDLFVCIDTSTEMRLVQELGPTVARKTLIIQNPFQAAPFNQRFNFQKYNSRSPCVTFAIVGAICEEKGVLFACRSFLETRDKRGTLFVVGDGVERENLLTLCDESAGRIVFLGEICNLVETGFFNSIDFLVRGDQSFRTGRTVFEALYAGKSVILPGDNRDLSREPALSNFEEKITFYTPNSAEGLTKAFDSVMRQPKCDEEESTKAQTNQEEYRRAILSVYGLNKLQS